MRIEERHQEGRIRNQRWIWIKKVWVQLQAWQLEEGGFHAAWAQEPPFGTFPISIHICCGSCIELTFEWILLRFEAGSGGDFVRKPPQISQTPSTSLTQKEGCTRVKVIPIREEEPI